MIIEILFKLIFWTCPMPGAPGLSLISNPPWYDAKTSPNPVLHSISTSCAICATSILDNLDFNASFNAIASDNATAPLEPRP